MTLRTRVVALLGRITLLCVSVLLVILIFEIGLRMAGYGAIYDVYSKPSAFWVPDPVLGWRHAPGSTGRYVGPRPWPIEFDSPIEINSLGLRGPEIPASGEDELRVLFLGDSMVAAFEVPYEDSFVSRTAEVLASRLGRPVRGINAGVRGYGTDQSLLYFRHAGHALSPDVVVFFHSRNDLTNNKTLHKMRRPMGKPAFTHRGDELVLVGSPTPTYPICSEWIVSDDGEPRRLDRPFGRAMCSAQLLLFDHSSLFSFATLRVPWDAGMLRRLYYAGFAQKPEARSERIANRPIAALTRDLIVELDREVSGYDAVLLVIGEDEILDELGADDLRARGVRVLGLGDRHDTSVTQFQNDSHFTVAGHRRVTDRLATPLEELLRERMQREREEASPAVQ